MIDTSIATFRTDAEINYCFILAILDFIKEKNNDDYINILKKVSRYSKGMFMDKFENLSVDKQQKILDLIKEKK